MYAGYIVGPLAQVRVLWMQPLGGYRVCDKRVDNGVSKGLQKNSRLDFGSNLMCSFTNRTMCLHVRNLLMRYAGQLHVQCLMSIW